jgi:putative transposase
VGINLRRLKNYDKMILIDALAHRYHFSELINLLGIPKSSYYYHQKLKQREDKYLETKKMIKQIFLENRSCYGYRRLWYGLRRQGMRISEKVIRRLMVEVGLEVRLKRRGKFNSYLGKISPPAPNILKQDFSAAKPNEKWLTDITEFRIPSGKVYLSPIVDCFDGLIVSWTVGTNPDSNLVNRMLDSAIEKLPPNSETVIHSDRGAHYRWPGWLSRIQKSELKRSMSRKGCTPDNAACEGFFGRLKNEMYYHRKWQNVSQQHFMQELDDYINWYNTKRLKKSLGGLSPIEYRKKMGLLN